jgi:heparin binding hemagglutinin HbhA
VIFMATTAKTDRKSGAVVTVALERARIPLLALVGVSDIAAKSVVDTVQKVRKQVNERAEAARSTVDELPGEISGLRSKLDPTELRKVVDSYTASAVQYYQYLAEHGEQAIDRLRSQPQVKRALEQAEAAAGDARELADDVLGRVTRRTRSVGEKTARATEKASDQAAAKVSEAGREAASTTRSTAQKAAASTSSARRSTSGGSTTRKPTSSK